MLRGHWTSLALTVGALLVAAPSLAEIDVRGLASAASQAHRSVSFLGRSELSAIVELPDGEDPLRAGLPRVGSHFSVLRAPLEDLATMSRAHPAWRVTWSAPLRP